MIKAFQWDLARQVERLDTLLSLLPRYEEWGYNQLYLHLEDAVEYPSLPEIARSDAYRFSQLERLVREAGRRGISVVPIVNLLGHTQYLIKVPSLRDLNELRAPDGSALEKGQVCPLHPRMPEIAATLLRDMAPLCTAGRVHVGLDESFHLGRHPLSRREIERVGLAAHFAGYVTRLHSLAEGLGLKMGLWADMLALIPEAIPLLPRGLAAYDWYYHSFGKHPRMELHNFAEYDLSPALRAQGAEYWACPMNGAFRYEPMPVFTDRLANLRAWWHRAQRVGAEGFLVTSWESYRLALELTTVVDAAAASLWLDPGVDDAVEMLARGFARMYGKAHCHRLARQALACDERAFAGYARWETNEHWDSCAPREGYGRHAKEERFFARLALDHDLPEPFAASVEFRLYLARRDVFLRRTQRELLQLRRLLARHGGSGYSPSSWSAAPDSRRHLSQLKTDCEHFQASLKHGRAAALRMWARTRDRCRRGQNSVILERDERRLGSLKRWLLRMVRRPALLWGNTPVLGAWQLQFTVHNFAPALQCVVVEKRLPDGTWALLRSRYTIEFRSRAARPRAKLLRDFSVPVPSGCIGHGEARLRIAVRGLGQVGIGSIELSNGVRTLQPATQLPKSRRVIGEPAPKEGFPHLDMSINRGEIELVFRVAE